MLVKRYKKQKCDECGYINLFTSPKGIISCEFCEKDTLDLDMEEVGPMYLTCYINPDKLFTDKKKEHMKANNLKVINNLRNK